MKEIQLTQGQVALVDDEDFEELTKYNWHARADGNTMYAARGLRRNGRWTSITMHQTLCPDLERVDHINGNGLDNRKENLRPATRTQNNMNRALHRNNSTGFKGVIFSKQHLKYRARITVEKRKRHIGLFDSPEEAAKAYDDQARIYFGEFAALNFPSDGERGAR
jgi:hypothetical protein